MTLDFLCGIQNQRKKFKVASIRTLFASMSLN